MVENGMEIWEYLPIWFSPLVSVISLLTTSLVTVFINKRSLQNAIKKEKTATIIEKMVDAPRKIVVVMRYIVLEMIRERDSDNTDTIGMEAFPATDYDDIFEKVVAYGSKDMVKEILYIDDVIDYAWKQGVSRIYHGTDLEMVFIRLAILVCLVKKDISGIEMSPDFWMNMLSHLGRNTFDRVGRMFVEIVNHDKLPKFLVRNSLWSNDLD